MTKEKQAAVVGVVVFLMVSGYWVGRLIGWVVSLLFGSLAIPILIVISLGIFCYASAVLWQHVKEVRAGGASLDSMLRAEVERKEEQVRESFLAIGRQEGPKPTQVFCVPFEGRESCEMMTGKKYHWQGTSGIEIMEDEDND